MTELQQQQQKYGKPDYSMCDGFGRPVDEDLYWRNTGLSQGAIEEIKEYHRTHPIQADGTRLKDDTARP